MNTILSIGLETTGPKLGGHAGSEPLEYETQRSIPDSAAKKSSSCYGGLIRSAETIFLQKVVGTKDF